MHVHAFYHMPHNSFSDISDNPIECESSTLSELPFIPLCEPFFESFEETKAECVDSDYTLEDICSCKLGLAEGVCCMAKDIISQGVVYTDTVHVRTLYNCLKVVRY